MRGWTLLSRKPLSAYQLLSLEERTMRNDRTGAVIPFIVAHLDDWVNVVAITQDGRVVFVEQARPGTDSVTLEIAGGTIDPGESPEDAARRELREETGYVAQRLIYLGKVAVNPAIQDNWCHFFAAPGAVKAGEPQLDPGEDIIPRLMTIAEVSAAIDSGDFVHSLGMLGFYKALRMLNLDASETRS
ncbi:MAG: NUDIX hydrolase [Bacillota bacterium]|nr:NUDIX hydrolase [Bacillota bacterium]